MSTHRLFRRSIPGNILLQKDSFPQVRGRKAPAITAIMLLMALFITTISHAQAPTISYPAAAQDLTRGYSQGNLTVKLVFNGVCTGATTVKIALPASVSYIAGSVSKTGGTTGLSIAEGSIADLGNPVLNISGIAAIGDNITFTVARNATCGSLATAKDSVYVFTSGGCSNASELAGAVNTYNIFSPSLAITPPAALTNALIGTTATRTTTIVNGGNGALDTLRFYVVYPGGGIVNTSGTNAITANGSSFTPNRTSGDTLFYKIFGATLFGGDNQLSNGETVTITEPVKVVKCNTTSAYGAGWGKTQATLCQTATGTSAVTMAAGVPNLGITCSYTPNATSSSCNGGRATVTYTNNGTGGIAGAVYDVTTLLGNIPVGVQIVGRNGFTADDPQLNGTGAVLVYSYAGGNTPNIVDMAQFTADPDGAGTGLDDLDGDGKFDDLAPGKSFSITYTRKVIYDTAACNFKYNCTEASQATYNTMCKSTVPVTTVISSGGSGNSWDVTGISKLAPPSVYPGVPFIARICVSGSFYPPNPATTDSIEVTVILPPGVTYTGTSVFNGASAPNYAVQTGTTLTLRQKWLGGGGSSGFCLSFDMTYDCSGTSNLVLPFNIQYVADRSCNAIYKMNCGDNIVINTHCPAPCPSGPTNHAAIVQRTTLGWTDKTLTTKVIASSLPALSLKTVTLYDTVNIKQGASQNSTYNNLYYYFQEDKAAGYDVFNYVNGTFHFKAGGVGTEIVCTLPAPDASAGTTALTKLKFNIGSLLGGACGLPATVNSTDSFWVDMNFTIGSPNNEGLYGRSLQTPASSLAYFYNLDATTTAQYCDVANPEVYVVGLAKDGAVDYSAPVTINGCTSAVYDLQDYRLYYGDPLDIFPGEYRPAQLVDSVVVTLPTGVYFDPSVAATLTYQYWNSLLSPQSASISVTPVASGNKLSFINPGSWYTSDISTYNSFQNARLHYSILPSCAIDPANTTISVTYYKHDFYYSGLRPQTSSTNSRTNALNYNATTAPSISLQNNTGTVQGVKTQQYWDVQVNSTGTTTAPYLWMALEKTSGSGIMIDSVVLKPGNVVMTPISYASGNQWYKVSATGIASGNTQQARVYFKYTNCTPDSILMRSGWNCTGYPSPDPLTGYACTGAQTYLKIIPQPSQVQLSVARQPGGGSSINLCTTDSTLLIVNSAQAANLVGPYVIFYPPAGVTMDGTIKVEYPLGSGNYQNAAISAVAGGGYKIDLTAHTAIGSNGLLGTALANPSFSPLGGDRQAKIKLDFTTSCGFTSGTSFTFNAYGSEPCGAAAIGNGVSAGTSALNITGATAAGSAGISMNFGSATSVSCGSAITFSLTTTPTSLPTTVGDTMVYTLPAGLAYAGNLTPGFTAVTTNQLVKVPMPVGVASGTPINYSFDVVASGGGCGSANITGAYQRSIAPLSCGGTPCTSSSVVIANGASAGITINKPTLVITGMSTSSTNWPVGTSKTVHLTYTNTGTLAYTANTDSVEFFCGSSTTPFATRALSKNVAIGAGDYDDFTILPPMGICAVGDLITARIQTVTSAGTPQCLCSPSSYTLAGVALPLTFISTDATADNCGVDITWQYDITGTQLQNFIIERSSDGRQFNAIATLAQATTGYTDVTPYSGNWYYRVKAVTADGKVTYSKTLVVKTSQCTTNTFKVYPNPAKGKVQVVLQGNSTNTTYELHDAIGRILLKGSLLGNSINLKGIAAGAYTLSIRVDGALHIQRLNIVQ
jgi:hypothetical protein